MSALKIQHSISSATNLPFLHQTLCNAHRCETIQGGSQNKSFSGLNDLHCAKCFLAHVQKTRNSADRMHLPRTWDQTTKLMLSTEPAEFCFLPPPQQSSRELSPAVQLLIAGAGSTHQELRGDRPTTATSNSSCRSG